jgi:hypothetical protein
MAKHKRNETPIAAATDGNQAFETLASALKDATVIRRQEQELVAEISIPISEELSREFPIHLDVTLPPPSATTLRRIAIALDRQQARTSDGQRVVKPTQALRWLLEQATIRPVQTTNQE